MKTFAKVLAVLAIVGLVLSSFAIGVGAQTTIAVSHASPMASFNRNLTIGSIGADVTALQTWLIARGFTIPAGATGYFGGQTQAALARFQASIGITPAAGYFGPITRGHVLATIQNPAPEPDEDDDKDEDEDDQKSDLNDAKEAIEDAEDALDDARNEVEEAEDDGDDINNAEDLLDEAEDAIDDARDALSDKDYDETVELAEDAENLINEALDEIDSREDEDDDTVSTSARVSRVDGANNDYATFEIELDVTPFNQDVYLSEDADVSFEYEIQDTSGNEVTGADSLTAYIESSAEEDDGYYHVEEDETESFTLIVVFDPLAADEGRPYRLQLLGINYAEDEEAPTDTLSTRPESKYRTSSVVISD